MKLKIPGVNKDKKAMEANFWMHELERYKQWYEGRLNLYGFPSPNDEEKIRTGVDVRANAVMTWNKLFQQKKYLSDLKLTPLSFRGLRVADIGCGPHPSALSFCGCEIYGVDQLVNTYKEIGFPIDYYEKRYHFVQCQAESLPFPEGFFDAVISVNAIDHVDDINMVSREIRRVLRPGGKVRMHIHYHKPTVCEPIELDDQKIRKIFGWIPAWRKVNQSIFKDMGFTQGRRGESFTIWSNF